MNIESHVLRRIVEAGDAAVPSEACGLLAAQNDARGNRIVRLYPLSNAADDPTEAFAFHPEERDETFAAAERAGLTIAGVSHSHPAGSSTPTRGDLENAFDLPGVIYAPEDQTIEGFSVVNGQYVLELINGEVTMQVGTPANGFFLNPSLSDVTWRVWVWDETQPDNVAIFSSDTHAPEDVPTRGVVVALQWKDAWEVDMVTEAQMENLILTHTGRWKGGSDEDVAHQRDILANPYPHVCKGHWIDTPWYEALVQIALDDPDFPQPGLRAADVLSA